MTGEPTSTVSSWLETNGQRLTSTTYDLRQSIGNGVASMTDNKITADEARAALPVVAAGAVGLGTLIFNDPLSKMGKSLFKGVRWVVTGGGTDKEEGFLEKIPLVGSIAKGLGWVSDKAVMPPHTLSVVRPQHYRMLCSAIKAVRRNQP